MKTSNSVNNITCQTKSSDKSQSVYLSGCQSVWSLQGDLRPLIHLSQYMISFPGSLFSPSSGAKDGKKRDPGAETRLDLVSFHEISNDILRFSWRLGTYLIWSHLYAEKGACFPLQSLNNRSPSDQLN